MAVDETLEDEGAAPGVDVDAGDLISPTWFDHSTYIFYSASALPRSEFDENKYIDFFDFKNNMQYYFYIKRNNLTFTLDTAGSPATEALGGAEALSALGYAGTTVTFYRDVMHLPMTGSNGILGKINVSPSGLLSGDSIDGETHHVHEYTYSDNEDDIKFIFNEKDSEDIASDFDLLEDDSLNNDYLTMEVDSDEQLNLNQVFGGHSSIVSTSGSVADRISLITADIYNTLSVSRYAFARTEDIQLTPENVHSITELETPSTSTIISGETLSRTETY